MKYVSTRDPERKGASYQGVLLEGLAQDGGLYVPKSIPRFNQAELQALATLPYEELLVAIQGLFVGDDIDAATQLRLARQAYDVTKFPERTDKIVAPVQHIDRLRYIQDLSLGPTAAFKDMALQLVGQHMQHTLSERGTTLDILGASSGDTLSAAGAAVIGNHAMRLFMLLPEEGPTAFQRAQAQEQNAHPNIHHLLFKGNFDDCHDIVKALNADPEFTDLGALNSINWARISAQIPYYFSGYYQVVGDNIGEPVDFVVPSGNFGNVLAGYVAKSMGLPIRHLVIATNENSVLAPLVNGGLYRKPDTVMPTSSPSMDIAVASNYERLFYWLSEGDAEMTSDYMRRFSSTGQAYLADYGLPNDSLLREGFRVGTSTHQTRLRRIAELYDTQGIVIDPHTADGVEVSAQYRRPDGAKEYGDDTKVIILSTARPVKFEGTIKEAIGSVPARADERFIVLESRAAKVGEFVTLSSVSEVKEYIRTRR